MKIKLLSDLHNEFGLFDIDEIIGNDVDILVLAGDIDLWVKEKYRYTTFLKSAAEFFRHVIFIAGNHEFYGRGDISFDCDDMKTWADGYDNIHFLENNSVVIDGVAFIGTTMWTDLDNANPDVMNVINYAMNDFRQIYVAGTLFDPHEWFKLNEYARGYLEKALNEFKNHKKVVITHHGPTVESVAECYAGQGLVNYAYVSTLLGDIIKEHKPEYWFHGHTHVSLNHMVHDTNVICNPRGYHGQAINHQFNPELVVEI